MVKYELTDDRVSYFGTTLYRIKALKSFNDVNEGDLGGYVESEKNLSHYGNAWVYGNAKVYGDAEVSGNARVYGNAKVYGNARVYGDARVSGYARVGKIKDSEKGSDNKECPADIKISTKYTLQIKGTTIELDGFEFQKLTNQIREVNK